VIWNFDVFSKQTRRPIIGRLLVVAMCTIIFAIGATAGCGLMTLLDSRFGAAQFKFAVCAFAVFGFLAGLVSVARR
jgi:uncharacterized membrane protein